MNTCKMGHPLQYSTDTIGYMGGGFSCDQCHTPSQCIYGRYNCMYCKYDICLTCYSKPIPGPMPSPYPAPGPYPYPGPMPGPMPGPYPVPGPFYQSTCSMGHPLAHSTSTVGYPSDNFTCNKCGSTYACVMGRYCCLYCRYDLCPTCKPN